MKVKELRAKMKRYCEKGKDAKNMKSAADLEGGSILSFSDPTTTFLLREMSKRAAIQWSPLIKENLGKIKIGLIS